MPWVHRIPDRKVENDGEHKQRRARREDWR
jgi:hypothetical protein